MLSELQVKNWMSYEKEKVVFSGGSTIAVVGENGHGKSSLLEAIPFTLFGDGRDGMKGLIRIGSDDGMSTALVLSDVPGPGRTMRVERGVTKGGNGYLKVWVDDELVEKGGASPSNNKAQDFVDAVLGIDSETFQLTAFFGLGTNDSLMQVRPSERLETLQKLAQVDICSEFHKVANEKAKDFQKAADEDKRAIEVASEAVADTDELGSELSKVKANLEKQRESLENLFAKRASLRKDEDTFQGLLREQEGMRQKKVMQKKQLDSAQYQLTDAEQEMTELKEKSREYAQNIADAEKALAEFESLEEYQKRSEEKMVEKASIEAAIKLRQTAATTNADDCPLCGAPLDSEVHKDWKEEIEALKEQHGKVKRSLDELHRKILKRGELEKQQDKLKSQMQSINRNGEIAKKQQDKAKKEIEQVKAEIKKTDGRLNAIREQMKGYDEIVDKMKDLDEKIGTKQSEVGSSEAEVKSLTKQIDQAKKAKANLKSLEKQVKEYMEKASGYKTVAEAFSRYAIPVQLLRNIREAIEQRSTRIYQHFQYGEIVIRDTEGAKPGVEFVLLDELGERPYKALSAGEKVMMFLAVRVAITQIINGSRNNMVDFLVLDEVAGNLSPTKRESLTKLINTLLKRYFSQIFAVSHVDLRDIFDRTLNVEKTNGVSHVA